MKIMITLDIPEEAVYAGVVADALADIGPEWDEGARRGEVDLPRGPVAWDSRVAVEGTHPARARRGGTQS